MKKIKIRKHLKERETSFKAKSFYTLIYDFIFKKISSVLSPINFILTIYLLIQNKRLNTLINEIKTSQDYN